MVQFAPINVQEADGPIITGQDPEQTTIYYYLLFPLYAFDLAESRNFRDLPPPDSPYDY